MKYLFPILAIVAFASCSPQSTKVVIPISTFSINFAGHNYFDQSDAMHQIKATVITSTDQFDGSSISVASLAVNSAHVKLYFAGQNSNAGDGTGSYYTGIRDSKDSTECPYELIDIGSNTVYTLDTFSTFSITNYTTYNISGYFKLNVWNGGTSYTATGNFSYNPYFGKL